MTPKRSPNVLIPPDNLRDYGLFDWKKGDMPPLKQQFKPGVSNMRPVDQNRPAWGYDWARLMSLENT